MTKKSNKNTKSASKAKRASKARASKVKKAKSLTKELMDKAVKHIASEIISAKPDVNGRTPRGYAERLLKEGKETFPNLNMNMINCMFKKIKDQLKKGALNDNAYSNISSLTGETESQSTASTSDNASNDNASGVFSIADNASSDNASGNDKPSGYDNAPSNDNAPKKTTDKIIGGRPKGSTDAAAKDLERRVEEATQEVVKNFKSKKKESRSSKKRLQYGLLDDMINLSKKKYCVPDNIIISKECIKETLRTITQDIGHR